MKQRFRFIAVLAVLVGLSAPCAHARRGEEGDSPRGQRPAAWVSPQGEDFGERAPSQAHGYEHAGEPPFEVQHFRRLSPEERRQLRHDIRNAGREVYRTRP
ncbi:hypothetical protein [Dentiradicibacter hellwigii]|uniref:Secreted protein n=1 Tax=Dentiradicibacter hellwigii TaxID=3149053 RepID=A0ABV4UE73_9RHOO